MLHFRAFHRGRVPGVRQLRLRDATRTVIEFLEQRQLLSAAASAAYGADTSISVPVGAINPLPTGVAIGQAGTHLTIVPTFDSTITSDPNAATIESSINSAIAVFENQFSTPITVSIDFQEMTSGLGESIKYYGSVPYSSYRSALQATATTTDDATAMAHLPTGTANPVNGSASVDGTLPQLRALGFNASPPSGQTDGTIAVNTSLCNITRTSIDPSKYDLMAVVSHEIDEVLAFGSALNGLSNGAAAPTGDIWGEDLYRYDQNGARSFNTNASAQAYFSIDGTTQLARFNQDAGGDISDWYSPGGQTPQVQDAFGTAGSTPDLGVELRCLDVLGYTPSTTHPAPVANNDVAATNENTAVLISELSNDSASGATIDPTTVHIVTAAGHGSTSVDPLTGKITYTPVSNYSGSDTFTYSVNDTLGSTSNAATVSLTVVARQPPVANNDFVTSTLNKTVVVDELANDTAFGGAAIDPTTVKLQSPTNGNGTISVDPITGKISYTPQIDTGGMITITYTVKDSSGAISNPATVTINILYPPDAIDDIYNATDYQLLTVNAPGVLANDVDPNGLAMTSSVVTSPAHGTLSLKADGSFTYLPNTGYAGTDSFTYQASDGYSSSSPTLVTLIVNVPIPVANTDTVVTTVNAPVVIHELTNDTTLAPTTLVPSSVVLTTFAAHGTAVIDPSTGNITYTPANNYVGGDGFTYTVNNSVGQTSNNGAVLITVNPVTYAGTPFPGPAATAVPGTIQAENFDNGGEAVAYHDLTTANQGGANYRPGTGVDLQATTDTGGGYQVGYINAGEWLKYSVNVATTGIYSLDLRLSNPNAGGKLHVEVDGVNVTGTINVPNTGSWNTWQTVTITGISLTAGPHVVRVAMDTNAPNGFIGNLNWFRLNLTQAAPPGPTVTAGANQSVNYPFPVTLNGSVTEANSLTLTSSWTQKSGPGTTTFANSASASTTAKFSTPGTYVLQLAGSDGTTTNTATVTITVNPDPGPVVNAGSNQTITLPSTASLSGSVTQTPLPPGATLTSGWSKKSGPGLVGFTSPNSPITTANFSTSGTYVLQLSGSDGITIITSTVTITVNPAPVPGPVVNAGSNQTINYPNGVSLSGSVTEQGATLTSTWTETSGPGTVVFANANNPVTNATLPVPGTYTLQLAGSDGTHTNTSSVTITVNPDPGPTVSAGSNQTITLPSGASLSGSATEILPAGYSVSSTWSEVVGPGTATFSNVSNVITTATFSLPGSYVLKLTATDGFTTNSSQVTITVNPVSTYGGTPFPGPGGAAVPGTIQAENFDNGGQGVAYNWQTTTNAGGANYRPGTGVGIQTTNDTGGGDNICYAVAGDWLKYTVNVASTKSYTLDLRVAQKAAGGQMHVEVDGVNVTGTISVPNTGSWSTWQTIAVSGINLTAGSHVVKVSFDTNANDNPGVANEQFVANLNWLMFV